MLGDRWGKAGVIYHLFRVIYHHFRDFRAKNGIVMVFAQHVTVVCSARPVVCSARPETEFQVVSGFETHSFSG